MTRKKLSRSRDYFLSLSIALLNEAATRRKKPKSAYTPLVLNSGHYLNRRIHHGPSRDESIQ
jgi:hypothetical protein